MTLHDYPARVQHGEGPGTHVTDPPTLFHNCDGSQLWPALAVRPCLKNDSSLQVIMPSEKLSIVEGLLRQVAPPDTCNASLCERTAAAVDAWFAHFSSFFPSRLSPGSRSCNSCSPRPTRKIPSRSVSQSSGPSLAPFFSLKWEQARCRAHWHTWPVVVGQAAAKRNRWPEPATWGALPMGRGWARDGGVARAAIMGVAVGGNPSRRPPPKVLLLRPHR